MHLFAWVLLLALIGLLYSVSKEPLDNPTGTTGTTGASGASGTSGPSGPSGPSPATTSSSSVATFGPTGATGASTLTAMMNGSGPTGAMPMSAIPPSTPPIPVLPTGPTGSPAPSSMFSGDQLMISSDVPMGLGVPQGPRPPPSLPGGSIEQTSTVAGDPRARGAAPIPYIASPEARPQGRPTSTPAPFS